jgi:hypothetical protein
VRFVPSPCAAQSGAIRDLQFCQLHLSSCHVDRIKHTFTIIMAWLSASLPKFRDIRKGVAEIFTTIFHYLTAGHTAAWKTSVAPINIFLNEVSLADRDELTQN